MNTFSSIFHVLLAWLLGFGLNIYAQLPEDEEDIKEYEYAINNGPPPARGYRMQIGAEVHSPHILLNPAHARAFDAIVGVGLNTHFKVWNNLYLGAHGEYNGFVIYRPIYVQPDSPSQSNLISSHVYALGSIMYMKIWESGVALIPSLRAGPGWVHYSGVYDANQGFRSLNYMGWVVQGLGGLYYFPFENNMAGVGLQLGATYFSHEFRKADMNLLGDDALTHKSDDGGTLHLSVGFSFVFNLGKLN